MAGRNQQINCQLREARRILSADDDAEKIYGHLRGLAQQIADSFSAITSTAIKAGMDEAGFPSHLSFYVDMVRYCNEREQANIKVMEELGVPTKQKQSLKIALSFFGELQEEQAAYSIHQHTTSKEALQKLFSKFIDKCTNFQVENSDEFVHISDCEQLDELLETLLSTPHDSPDQMFRNVVKKILEQNPKYPLIQQIDESNRELVEAFHNLLKAYQAHSQVSPELNAEQATALSKERIAELQSKLEQAQAELQQAQEKDASHQEELIQAKQNLQDSQSQLQAALEQTQEKDASHRKELIQTKAALEQTKADLVKAQKVLEQTKADLVKAQEDLKQTQTDLEKATDASAKVLKEYEGNDKAISKIKFDLHGEALITHLESLQTDYKEEFSDIFTLSSWIDAFGEGPVSCSELSDKPDIKSRLQTRFGFEFQYFFDRTFVNDVCTKLLKSENEKRQLSEKVASNTTKLEKLQTKYQPLLKENKELKKEKQALESKVQKFQATLNNKNRQIKRLQSCQNGSEPATPPANPTPGNNPRTWEDKLKDRITELEEKIRDLTKQLRQANTNNTGLQRRFDKLTEKNRIAEEELAESKRNAKDAQLQLSRINRFDALLHHSNSTPNSSPLKGKQGEGKNSFQNRPKPTSNSNSSEGNLSARENPPQNKRQSASTPNPSEVNRRTRENPSQNRRQYASTSKSSSQNNSQKPWKP